MPNEGDAKSETVKPTAPRSRPPLPLVDAAVRGATAGAGVIAKGADRALVAFADTARAAANAAIDAAGDAVRENLGAAERRPGTEPNEACPDDHDLAIWFTPDAIREAEDGETDGLTDAELAEAAKEVNDRDFIWRVFHEAASEIVELAREAHDKAAKAKDGAKPGAPA